MATPTTRDERSLRAFWLVCLFSGLVGIVSGQTAKRVVITGDVTDERRVPLESANVQLIGTFDGDVTNSRGRFRFVTGKIGIQELRASMIGYEPAVVRLNLSHGDSVVLRLVLKEMLVNLKEVTVTASAYATGDEVKGMTLRSLEVITTPSAAADIFRALQTFPGVVAVDEGSGLFVRGGDVSETIILLDQATVVHPYRYESPTGGYFGTISPFLVSGTFFSSGGFSARYGNALSSILAMESLNLPTSLTYSFNAGLAAGSVAANVPIIPQKLGVRISGNQSFTGLMFRVNGVRNRFTIPPSGHDANLSIVYKYSSTGQLKFFNFVNVDRIGVRVDEPSFDGVYESEETNWLHNLQWADALSDWFVKASISMNRFGIEQQLGNMRLKPSDETYKFRVDAERSVSDDLCFSFGAEVERSENRFLGTLPRNSQVLDPSAEVYRLDERYATQRWGAYSEVEAQLSRRWMGSGGVRVDYHNLARESVIDPRLSLRYNFSKETNARMSWGVYHEFPQPALFDQQSGNPSLHAQSAQHVIAGFEHANDLFMIRVEAYHKVYHSMVLRNKACNYTNDGRGYAQGVDLFLKYGGFLQTPYSGWISYSYLRSRRLQARDLVDRYVYEEAPSSFDITHNLTVVAKAQVIQFLSAGVTFHYATGRPETPVIGAVYRPEGAYYEPIQGPINSERLPDFVRVDATLSYFLPFGDSNSAVFYFSVSNVLDRANAVRLEYSRDYSERRLRTSDYRRFIYFGVGLSIGSLGT